MSGAARQSYTFQVTLLAVTPSVWRLLAVPGRLTLAQLHDVIQVAMGWTRAHPYRFDIAGQNYEAIPDAIRPDSLSLDRLGLAQGSSLTYIYDFQDDWVHHLTVQGVAPSTSSLSQPVLLGGAGACPPEASGGPGGYASLLAALRNPDSSAGQEARRRLGSLTDPGTWDAGPAAKRVAGLSSSGHQPKQSAEGRSRKHRRGRR